MKEQQSTERRSGDKGEWYFRMLGLGAEESPTELGQVNRSDDTTRTSQLVTGMWDQTAEMSPAVKADDPLAGWEPTQLNHAAASKRTVRWPVIVVALVVGSIAAFSLWWLPQASEQRAATHAELMRVSVGALYTELGQLQQALATATEPTSEVADLESVSAGLAGVSGSATALLSVANLSVPEPLPLSPHDSFDDIEELRPTLEPLAAEATSIADAVAAIAEYRNALGRVLLVDELPLTADSATVTQQRTALAKSLADTVAALSEMPTDGPFADHRALVDAATTKFAQWQNDYLEALREGNIDETSRLVAEFLRSRVELFDALVANLAALRTEIDGRILELAERLSLALQSIPI